MQNPNPAVIWYHIHDNTKWLPLISDVHVEHPKIIEDRHKDDNKDDDDDDADAAKATEAAKAGKKKGKKADGDKKDPKLFEM